MVLPQRRCAGLTGSVAKVAAGALDHLPVARVVNLNRALESLKQEGYRVIGLAAEGTLTLEEADLEGPLVVVTGSEGEGLSMLTRRHCDQLVRIPLRGSTPSLNASVATALLLYEIARRGWMRGLRGQAPAPRLQRPQLPATPLPEAPDITDLPHQQAMSARPDMSALADVTEVPDRNERLDLSELPQVQAPPEPSQPETPALAEQPSAALDESQDEAPGEVAAVAQAPGPEPGGEGPSPWITTTAATTAGHGPGFSSDISL
jgi:23S rRNA (guanosine2251-2'-O)-methyltransferase